MRKKDCTVTVKQIVPAPGWRAVYAVEPEKDGDSVAVAWEIVGWALVSHEECCRDTHFLGRYAATMEDVVPLGFSDCGVTFVDEGNYLGCIGPGEEIPAHMIQEARRSIEKDIAK